MARTGMFNILWQQNRAMSLVVLLLLFANLGAFLLQSQLFEKQLQDVRSEVRERQHALRNLKQQKEAGSMPVSALTQVENQLAAFQKMIPPRSELSAFIKELFSYADSSKLEIKQINYQPAWDEELALLSYNLQFSVSGEYRQLKKFIHLLEGSERILIISDISLSGGEGRKEKNAEVSLRIQMKTFFRGEAA
ncbi:MAG: type 4a pilus biogenesis protein PilO [Desulfuromonadales bacterium]|nr:type 4a pilus biogenesis protein PilO [Desulfuromonadales bacterium]